MSRAIPQPPPRKQTSPARLRRSRYRAGGRLAGVLPVSIIALAALVSILAASLFAARIVAFLNTTTANGGVGSVVKVLTGDPNPTAGTIAYHLKVDKQPVNILLLGYGGPENDAPYLSDTILIAHLDPATGRVALVSVPRDLWVQIKFGDSPSAAYFGKVNEAFAAGQDGSPLVDNALKSPRYTGKDGGGHLAEDVIGRYMGLKFDGYVGLDFKAFRDVVDALGGVTVHMDAPLDDCHYPNYHNGFVNHGVPDSAPCPYRQYPDAGIHFKAGDYQVNGEQALQIARSRHADEPVQATDFGRARRQQMLIAAIKEKAAGVNGLAKAPQLMDALQKDFKTDMKIDDLTALYNWGKNVKPTDFAHLALSTDNLLVGGIDACGNNYGAYTLCPYDPTFITVKAYVAHALAPPSLAKKPVALQVTWSGAPTDVMDQATAMLRAYPFAVADPGYIRGYNTTTTIYDFSGGNPEALAFLTDLLGAQQGHAPQVIVATDPAARIPAGVVDNKGFVLYLGRDFGRCWYGYADCKR